MKVLAAVIFFITSTQHLNAQANGDIILNVAKIADTICKETDFLVSLKLSNISRYPIIVPGRYFCLAINDYSEFFYEIIYVENDKIMPVTKMQRNWGADVHIMKSGSNFKILEPGMSEEINCNLDYGYFKKIGNYKTRFTYRATKYSNCMSKDLQTEWIPVYLNKEDIIE
jgi:hypothetical protein